MTGAGLPAMAGVFFVAPKSVPILGPILLAGHSKGSFATVLRMEHEADLSSAPSADRMRAALLPRCHMPCWLGA